ncbi:MAG: hypothetical protein GOVbin1096_114 [Prokaryotic dsDNA virus sp.]|jgi:hypothetical protein|nr:MAG: hypothetical protein GOVbin1096_114 [Prokaryotic dsDNA virus sp.]|tara:strand:- start:26619 stop:26768 length:150 start_codon:yes stop_codon:yes gene_type:complete
MKSEFSANQIFALEAQKEEVEAKIRNHVGIVPASWYDELDAIEIKLVKV